MTDFTPGPWFAGKLVKSDEDYDFGTVSVGPYDLSDRLHKDCHYEDTICEVWQNPNLAEDAEDNARLIAQAPALYEAATNLRTAQRAYMEVRNSPQDIRDAVGRAVAHAAEELDRVLALATGSRRAKTPQAVECEASQSGPKGNAQGDSQ
jgi:hypothetical protein